MKDLKTATSEDLRAFLDNSLREDEELTDPATGILLTPSWHGEKCQGNGEHPGKECCCDECDHYLACFPDWKTHTT